MNEVVFNILNCTVKLVPLEFPDYHIWVLRWIRIVIQSMTYKVLASVKRVGSLLWTVVPLKINIYTKLTLFNIKSILFQ